MADGFLGRWSRRKHEVREGKPVEDPPPPPAATGVAPPLPSAVGAPPAQAAPRAAALTPQAAAEPVAEPAPAAPPAPTLADAQALTPASDFKAFVARDVAPEVRNLAMKKLFADPHFNVMDGLDIYIGDYTQPDPLPDGMLRKMVSAHALGFFDHEKETQQPAAPEAAAQGQEPHAIAPALAQPRDDAGAAGASDVAQSGVCAAVPGAPPTSEPALADRSAPEPVAMPASQIHDDHDAHLRLQPDDAPQRPGAGPGAV